MDTENTGDPEYPLEALASLPALFHPAASPSGDRVAYYYDVTGRNELYVLDVERGEHRRVSDGDVPRDAKWAFRWDATGERVYFHRDDAGDEQHDVHAFSLDDARRETVLETDGQTYIAEPSPDGRYLVYASDERDQLNLPVRHRDGRLGTTDGVRTAGVGCELRPRRRPDRVRRERARRPRQPRRLRRRRGRIERSTARRR